MFASLARHGASVDIEPARARDTSLAHSIIFGLLTVALIAGVLYPGSLPLDTQAGCLLGDYSLLSDARIWPAPLVQSL